jgi:hypothetical protein
LKNGKTTKKLEPLFCYCISAKRYALFNIDERGRPVLRKISAHGLGHLLAPYEESEAPADIPAPVLPPRKLGGKRWEYDLWYRIVTAELAGHPDQVDLSGIPGYDQPTASQYAATTPALLGWFDDYNDGKPYTERVKPFGFLLGFHASKRPALRRTAPEAGQVSPNRRKRGLAGLAKPPQPVAPFHKNPRDAIAACFDRETGRPVKREELETYREALAQYHVHPETKFLNGRPYDRGVTQPRHVRISSSADIRHIGKEANKWEEQFYLGFDVDAQIDYGIEPEAQEKLLIELRRVAKAHPRQVVADAIGISVRGLYAILTGTATPTIGMLARIRRALPRLFFISG